jgi:hypothetical protein
MLKSCNTCRHDPKSCKFQNYNDKCNGHQLVSITEIIKERDKLQVLGLESEKLTEQIEYFYYGRK